MNCSVCGAIATDACFVANRRTAITACPAQQCRARIAQCLQSIGPPIDDSNVAERIVDLERRVAALEERNVVTLSASAAAAAPARDLPIAVIQATDTETEMARLRAILDFPIVPGRLQSVRLADLQPGQRSILFLRPVGTRIPMLSQINQKIATITAATGHAPLVIVLILMSPGSPPHQRMESWDEDRLVGAAAVVRFEAVLTRREDETPLRWIGDSKTVLRRFIEN